MLDRHGKVIYVGKAKNLKKRLTSYFVGNKNKNAKTQQLISQIDNINYIITDNEISALLLEYQLIKYNRPKYNVLFKDDKSYPYILLTEQKKYPQVLFHRSNVNKPIGKYYGPYPNINAVKKTIELIKKIFKLRQCNDSYFKARTRPCLQYQIKRCSAPCVGLIDFNLYQANVKNAKLFLGGKFQEVIDNLFLQMQQAAQSQNYELAATLRDQIKNINFILERQKLPSNNNIEASFLALSDQIGIPIKLIECFDVSHLQGEATVASCVIFDQHGEIKSDYRLFNIRNTANGDDYLALEEALTRHLTKKLIQDEKMADLLLIDGGKGQLACAASVLEKLQIKNIQLISMAKGENRKPGLETIYIYKTTKSDTMDISADSAVFRLIQQIRDEAHRFAITCHRKQRNKKRVRSILEDIPGVGVKRRRDLIRRFGGINEIINASMNELASVPGIGIVLAKIIYENLHGNK